MIEARDEKGDRAVTHNPRTTQPLVLATGVTRLTFPFRLIPYRPVPHSFIPFTYRSAPKAGRCPDRTG